MGSCVAYGCTNSSAKKLVGITFHSFPKNEERRKLWENALRRDNWSATKHSKVCSAHFPEEMIDRTSLSCVRLRENAVPIVNKAFPPHLQKEQKPRKPRKVCGKETTSNSHPSSLAPLDVVAGEEEKNNSTSTRNDYKRQIDHLSNVLDSKNKKIKEQKPRKPRKVCGNETTSNSHPSSLAPLDVVAEEEEKNNSTSPTKNDYKRQIDHLSNALDSKNKKIKVLQQKTRRYKKKICKLKRLLDDLNKTNYLNEEEFGMLETVADFNKEFFSKKLAILMSEGFA